MRPGAGPRAGGRTARRALLALALLLPAGCAAGVTGVGREVLRGEVRWRGRVEVTGPVLVDRGARLVIEPGTEVVFRWTDADGDGIGDGALNVLGTLEAAGTAARPVVFRGARRAPKSWTYVAVEGGRGHRIAWCRFRDAFTGLQLHYVPVDVERCLFEANHEGLRYSTIEGTIRRNSFLGNGTGIRFEGRGARVLAEANEFRGNETAVFAVTRGSARDRFRGNNFSDNGYDVKLGVEQAEDLDFRGNWWEPRGAGRAPTLETVREGIFDGRREPGVGTVLVEPFLAAPAPDAGVAAVP